MVWRGPAEHAKLELGDAIWNCLHVIIKDWKTTTRFRVAREMQVTSELSSNQRSCATEHLSRRCKSHGRLVSELAKVERKEL